MEISSIAFENGQEIPFKYSCQGENHSPALHIAKIPDGTVTLAIVCEDPDAPAGTYDHWIAWNIAPASDLIEGVKLAEQGMNSSGTLGYKGPCPPPGKPHRYYFKIYALDSKLTLPEGSTKEALNRAMKGHLLGEAKLMGTYQRPPS
jgi:Raf kinase inhibitor-like YbhB/YbcL family protein